MGYRLFILHYKQRKQFYCPEPYFCQLLFFLLSSYPMYFVPTHEPGNVSKFVYKGPNFIWVVPQILANSKRTLSLETFLLNLPSMTLSHPPLQLHKIYHTTETRQVQMFRCCVTKRYTRKNRPPPKNLYSDIEMTTRKPKLHRCCNNLTLFLMTCADRVSFQVR